MTGFELVCEHEKANAEGICVRQNGENLCLPPVWFWFSVALVLRMSLGCRSFLERALRVF